MGTQFFLRREIFCPPELCGPTYCRPPYSGPLFIEELVGPKFPDLPGVFVLDGRGMLEAFLRCFFCPPLLEFPDRSVPGRCFFSFLVLFLFLMGCFSRGKSFLMGCFQEENRFLMGCFQEGNRY